MYVQYVRNMTLCQRKLGVIDHSAGHGHVCVPSCQWFPKCTSAHLCAPQTDSTTERILIILLDFATYFFFFFLSSRPLFFSRFLLADHWNNGWKKDEKTIVKERILLLRIYYSRRILFDFLKRTFWRKGWNFWWILMKNKMKVNNKVHMREISFRFCCS